MFLASSGGLQGPERVVAMLTRGREANTVGCSRTCSFALIRIGDSKVTLHVHACTRWWYLFAGTEVHCTKQETS